MNGLLLLLAVIVILFAVGVCGVIRARIKAHGILVLTWRFLTGHPWHGKPVTDAGWLRPGTKALTRTGHASRFHHRPRLHRTAMRTGSCLAIFLLLYGMAEDPALTSRVFLVTLAALILLAAVRAVVAVRGRSHRRKWVDPLHVALAQLLNIPLPNKPGSWLTIDRDRGRPSWRCRPGSPGTPATRSRSPASSPRSSALRART
jgi:hypothetical protein